MFTITSNPFAEMTQGLSGQTYTEQVESSVHKPNIENDDDDHEYEYRRSSSSGWWKVVLILIILLSGVGLFLWFYSNYQIKKEEERVQLDEEQKKLTVKQKEITS